MIDTPFKQIKTFLIVNELNQLLSENHEQNHPVASFPIFPMPKKEAAFPKRILIEILEEFLIHLM